MSTRRLENLSCVFVHVEVSGFFRPLSIRIYLNFFSRIYGTVEYRRGIIYDKLNLSEVILSDIHQNNRESLPDILNALI